MRRPHETPCGSYQYVQDSIHHRSGNHFHAEVFMKAAKKTYLTPLSILLGLALLMFVLTGPVPARADLLYDYTYTGMPFTQWQGLNWPGQPSDYRMTVSFRFGDLTPVLGTAQPLDFYIGVEGPPGWSGGIYRHDLGPPEWNAFFEVDALDPAGCPSQWAIGLYKNPNTGEWEGIYSSNNLDLTRDAYFESLLSSVWNTNSPGTWARTQVVPLPASALLLSSGLIPLAWASRKKRLGK
jgi:hypothetical protein